MDRTKRENAVILFVSRDGPRTRYCDACVDYNLNIHGACPGGQSNVRVCKHNNNSSYVGFDNTKYIPISIYNNPCKGREFGCTTNCDRCVLIKRKFVTEPEIQ